MDRKYRSFRPQGDGLESRHLLSHAAPPPGLSLLLRGRHLRANPAPAGTIQGRYFAAEDNRAADAPLHVGLNGSGRVDGIGRANLTGSLDLGGFRAAGAEDVGGTLKLANTRGTVTLRLTGSGGFNDVPGGEFVTSASVVKGTGAFRNFRRIGTVTLDFGPNDVRAIRAPSPIGGTMAVTLNLKPPVR